MRLGFDSPAAGLVGLAGIAPIVVAFMRARAGRALRAELGLPEPSRGEALAGTGMVALVFVLVGLGAAQPVVRTGRTQLARHDAQVLIAMDNSRSMLATTGRGGTPRFVRAKAFARELRTSMPQIPTGLAAFSDRVLPYLFPSPDPSAFEDVLTKAYRIGYPGPEPTPAGFMSDEPAAYAALTTSFDGLEQLARADYFGGKAKKRVAVILTDAEGDFEEPGIVQAQLRRAGIVPLIVRFGTIADRVYDPDGTQLDYQPFEAQVTNVEASGIPMFGETQLEAVVARIDRAVGPGRATRRELELHKTRLAPWIALAALIPLALVLAPGGAPRLRRGRREAPAAKPTLVEV